MSLLGSAKAPFIEYHNKKSTYNIFSAMMMHNRSPFQVLEYLNEKEILKRIAHKSRNDPAYNLFRSFAAGMFRNKLLEDNTTWSHTLIEITKLLIKNGFSIHQNLGGTVTAYQMLTDVMKNKLPDLFIDYLIKNYAPRVLVPTQAQGPLGPTQGVQQVQQVQQQAPQRGMTMFGMFANQLAMRNTEGGREPQNPPNQPPSRPS